MIKKVKYLLVEHSSLAVMGVGSLFLFLANISLKEVLNIHDYYQYSIIITVITLLNSFGALGMDQVFLRLSEIQFKKNIIVDVKIIYISVIGTSVSSFIGCYYLKEIANLETNYVVLFLLCFGVILTMLLYNVFRLSSDFFISQLIQNSWKFFMGILAAVYLISVKRFDYVLLLVIFMWGFIFLSFVLLIKQQKILLQNTVNYSVVLKYSLNFFITLLTLSFVAQGDRFLIEEFFSKKDFGDYFFLATLFLFPFSLFQSYIGFKELVFIKTEKLNLSHKLKRISLGTFVFSLVLLIVVFFLSKLNIISLDFFSNIYLILIFIIMGNIRMLYSLFSAIIGATASLSKIKKLNILFLTLVVLSLFVFVMFVNKSVLAVTVYFCFLWLSRLVLWGYYSIN